jgi:hypothetical protein
MPLTRSLCVSIILALAAACSAQAVYAAVVHGAEVYRTVFGAAARAAEVHQAAYRAAVRAALHADTA